MDVSRGFWRCEALEKREKTYKCWGKDLSGQ